jgi:rhodanese-related sulfurtransferase
MPDMSGVPEIQPAAVPAEAFVLDVREPDEWVAGHAVGAVHMPMNEVPARLGELPDTEIVVICKSGGRSAQVTQFLMAQGRRAVNLGGGTTAWQAAGRPMASETGQDPFVV